MQVSNLTWCGADATAICSNERRDLDIGEKEGLPLFG